MGRATIKAEEYQLIGTESGKGYSIELSPYDVPSEVEGKFDKKSGDFHILFKYVDEEEADSSPINEVLTMKLGKHSGKILGFVIRATKYNINEITLTTVENIDRALDEAIPHLSKYNQKANYRVIKSVLHKNREPIFAH